MSGVPAVERFLAKTDRTPGGCWLWTGAIQPNGYGYFSPGKSTMRYAHRISYALFVEPIPTGMDLDHLCRVRHCVNPAHLEPVTRRVNLMRSEATLTKAHHDGRDCGFDGCPNCKRFRVAS